MGKIGRFLPDSTIHGTILCLSQRIKHLTKGLLGLVATVLLHTLFLAAIWTGGVSPQLSDLPDAIGAGANLGKPEGESAERSMTVRLLSQSSTIPNKAPKEALLEDALRSAAVLDITGPDALPLPPLYVHENGVPADSTQAELIAREKLFGIYQSQIRARIERAWAATVPKPGSESFKCEVLIRQQPNGSIREVELPIECGGSPEMRQSLIYAIFLWVPDMLAPASGSTILLCKT